MFENKAYFDDTIDMNIMAQSYQMPVAPELFW